MAGIPFTEAEQAELRRLHQQGLSRNAIAEAMDRPKVTISRWAERLGLSFDREATRAATEARQVDLKDRRQRLQERLLEDAERMREQLWSPMLAYSFGGRDNVFTAQQIPEPGPADKRALMSAIGMAIDKTLRLAEFDAEQDDSNTAVDRFLEGMGASGDETAD